MHVERAVLYLPLRDKIHAETGGGVEHSKPRSYHLRLRDMELHHQVWKTKRLLKAGANAGAGVGKF